MCAIVVAYDTATAIELFKLNSYRGVHSHSVAIFDEYDGLIFLHQGEGELDPSLLNNFKRGTIVMHSQAPTTQNSGIHPAALVDIDDNAYLLWHNGIIKPYVIEELKQKYNLETDWDTQLILNEFLMDANYSIDGSYACVMYRYPKVDELTGNIQIFRNEIAPLFYSHRGISSTKFEGSIPVPANQVFTLVNRALIQFDDDPSFKTVNNPYYIPERY